MQSAPDGIAHGIFEAVGHLTQSVHPLTLATTLITMTFLVHLVILQVGTRRLKRAVNQVRSAGRFNDKNSTLASALGDFDHHLIDHGGNRCRTASAEFFLHDTAILNGFLPVRHLAAASNFMLTTGILCTFLSLAVGLRGRPTIDRLTPYVGSALLSSVIGLLFSLIFSFLQSIYLERARNAVRSLVVFLDGKYALVTLEWLHTAEMARLGGMQSSLVYHHEWQERVLLPRIEALFTATLDWQKTSALPKLESTITRSLAPISSTLTAWESGRLRETISESLKAESEHIKKALVASLAGFEASWKRSVESTLDAWSLAFVKAIDSRVLAQLQEVMAQLRSVVTSLAALERRIETIPQRVDESASATLASVTASFNDGAAAIRSGVAQLVSEFDRGTAIVVKGFARDLAATREVFAQEVRQATDDGAKAFAATFAKSLDSANVHSAAQLEAIANSIKKAASDVQSRFAEIEGAYEGFNRQHARFRAEIRKVSITLHEWHEDAVRTETKLLNDWTARFASDLSRLGKELNGLIAKAGHEAVAQIEHAAQDRAETLALLREVVRALRNRGAPGASFAGTGS